VFGVAVIIDSLFVCFWFVTTCFVLFVLWQCLLVCKRACWYGYSWIVIACGRSVITGFILCVLVVFTLVVVCVEAEISLLMLFV